MDSILSNRKNLLICLIIILEIAACSFSGAEIFDLSSAHIFERNFSRSSDKVNVNVAHAAAGHTLRLNAKLALAMEDMRWKGPVLSKSRGTITGPSGKETYYNLNMSGVVRIMRRMGNTDEYWVRDDGVKMLGDYVMVAANLNLRPRGSLVDTSLGKGIVCDTGSFASRNPTQLDIAVTW